MTKSSLHTHGCKGCHLSYEDACGNHRENDLCSTCKTGKPGLYNGQPCGIYQPQACCFEQARPARKDELTTYKLSPSCPWFLCNACKRQYPFSRPKEVEAS